MIMPFGKYKGSPVSSLPSDYISWLLENCKNMQPKLKYELMKAEAESDQLTREQEEENFDTSDLRGLRGK